MADFFKRPGWVPWWAMVLAVSLAACLYGSRVIFPTHFAWMLHGDAAQHLNGMAFFLSEPWHWPAGLIDGFGGPGSVVFTDSIPWLALFLKGVRWPSDWQPFGIWFLMCHGLAAALSVVWFQIHRVGALVAVCYAVVLAFAPTLLLRVYGHEALMAHFLIPGALILSSRPWSPWRWGLWLLLSLGIHAYWVVMVGALALAAALHAGWSGSSRWHRLALDGLGIGVVMLACAYLLGYGAGDGSRSSEGFGYYSANMLSWFDPMDWLGFLKFHGMQTVNAGEWSLAFGSVGQSSAGQYEGFAWLGGGILGLGFFVLIFQLRRFWMRPRAAGGGPSLSEMAPWMTWFAALVLALWSWSHVWGWGSTILVSWPLPASWMSVLGVFRASGRFIWPLTWLLMLFICLSAARWRHAWVWASLALLVQWVDLSPKLAEFHLRFRSQVPGAVAPLSSPVWLPLLQRCNHLALLSPRVQDGTYWAPAAWLAAQAKASMHPAPTARLTSLRESEMQSLIEALAVGERWNPAHVYLIWAEALPPATVRSLVAASELALPARQVLSLEGYLVIAAGSCFSSPHKGH